MSLLLLFLSARRDRSIVKRNGFETVPRRNLSLESNSMIERFCGKHDCRTFPIHGGVRCFIKVFVICHVISILSVANCVFAQSRQAHDKNSKSASTFKIDHDEPIILPGIVFDKPIGFILDTGSSLCALDMDFQPRLETDGDQIQAMTPSGALKIRLFKPPPLEILTTPMIRFQSRESIACFDLKEVKQAMGVDEIGILGMDFLKTRIIHLDFDKEIGSFETSSVMNDGHIERLHTLKQSPAVLLRFPSEGWTKFMIDTGFDGCSLRL